MKLVRNVVKLKPRRRSVENVLKNALAESHRFENVVVIAYTKEGGTFVNWSKQKNSDLLWNIRQANRDIESEVFKE